MPNKNDLGAAMNTLVGWIFKKYNGVLVERSGTGFKVGDKYYPTWEDMIKDRDKIRQSLYKSIHTP